MKILIRTRLLLWLLAATLPIVVASLVAADRISDRLSENAAQQLENFATIEKLHLQTALAGVEANGVALAAKPELALAVEALDRNRSSFAPSLVLKPIAEQVLANSTAAGGDVEAVRITDRGGLLRGESDTFAWPVGSQQAAMNAMEMRKPVFGLAFSTPEGTRLGLAVPIVASDGSVVGALLLEHDYDPLIVTLASFDDVGRTTEASLVQRLDNGAIQSISIHRFARDSAFNDEHGATEQIPSVLSLDAVDTNVVNGPDYRGVETIAAVTKIEPVGWGLTIKIDKSEALELANQVRLYVVVATVLTTLVILAGWLTFVRPLGRRLQLSANASHRVADGNYESRIDDTGQDEISDLSQSIDRLASDLQADIAARELAEEKLRFQANHDALTGLINRQHATSIIGDLERNDLFSLLFIDLDRFKEINDTYGHAIGDEVLTTIARRLEPKLPTNATLCRWGGDEFLVILPDVDDDERVTVASDLRLTLNEPIATAIGPQTVGMSIGGATSSKEQLSPEVLAAADAEMFKMKRFQASVNRVPAEVRERVELALAEDRVEPFYQPVVRVDEESSVHLVGAEALVRIRGRDDTIVPPGDFLPALGNHQLARRIDFDVITQAIADLASWHRRGIVPEGFRVAFNVGPATIRNDELVMHIELMLGEHAVSPDLVLIEVPETVESVDPKTLEQFRNLGVKIAIDDVGVQYSNLERMVDLQADVAKLDRRWIPSMATAELPKAEVLRALVDQCTTLGMDIIAEGIETKDQLEMLRDLGVDVFQGYLFSRPLSLFDFERVWGSEEKVSFRGIAGVSAEDLPAA